MIAAQFSQTCLVFLVLSLTGCSSYVKYKYGISKPRPETPGSLLVFLEKNDYPVENQYVFRDSGSFVRAMRHEVFRKNLLSHMIFDQYGRLLESDSIQCQWAGADRIRALHPDSSLRYAAKDELSDIIRAIKPIGHCSCDTSAFPVPDFTIVITWGKFLGRYNYRLFDLEKAVNARSMVKIRTIWLNVDIQKSWKLKGGRGLELK